MQWETEGWQVFWKIFGHLNPAGLHQQRITSPYFLTNFCVSHITSRNSAWRNTFNHVIEWHIFFHFIECQYPFTSYKLYFLFYCQKYKIALVLTNSSHVQFFQRSCQSTGLSVCLSASSSSENFLHFTRSKYFYITKVVQFDRHYRYWACVCIRIVCR